MTQPDPTLFDHEPHLRLVEGCEVTQVPCAPTARPFAYALNNTRAGRAYLDELQAIPPLTREDERALALRIEQGERQMLEALLTLPEARRSVLAMLGDAAAGRIPLDAVLDESPGDEVARARLARLLSDLEGAQDDESARLLAEVRIGRRALEQLASSASARCPNVEVDVAGGRRIAEGAKRELVRRHLWLAVAIASRHPSRGLDILDRVQEGNLGLLRAADRFRVRKGFRFATYAAWWVRQAINRAAAEQGHCVRLPLKTLEAAQKADQVRRRYNARTGQPAGEQLVAKSLSVSVERLREVQQGVSDAVSVEASEEPLLDPTPTPEHRVAAFEQRRVLLEQLATLEPRERRVLVLRFGLEDEEEATRDDVAKVFSLTRERIRQIENRALERLQHPTRADILRAV